MAQEFGWGDGIYSGAAHLVATHKRPKHQPLTYDHAFYNNVHAWYRSRAEHWFAHLWNFNVVKNVWTGRGEVGLLKLANRLRVLIHFVNFREKRKRRYLPYGPWPHFKDAVEDDQPVPIVDDDPEALQEEEEDAL